MTKRTIRQAAAIVLLVGALAGCKPSSVSAQCVQFHVLQRPTKSC